LREKLLAKHEHQISKNGAPHSVYGEIVEEEEEDSILEEMD